MNNGIFLLLGTNQGDKTKNLKQAIAAIGRLPAVIINESSIYRTAAWGKTDQHEFYNQVIEIGTVLTPQQLLKNILEIETDMGRVRNEKWGPRIIDIDILFYQDAAVNDDNLTIPHPGITGRRFTLIPLVEIAPEFTHPVLKKSMEVLLFECTDSLEVTRTDN
jgi:2-amino-4-hydroxy-6-hydroxymethyldihydropteridine diphosphokinase